MPELITELKDHYSKGTQDMDSRRTRKNGWNDIIDVYMNRLPGDWPYQVRVVDPRARTSIIEKNGRLLNAKLRGTLVPREGGDIVSARINNTILDYQWDAATLGGPMIEKAALADLQARLFGSSFGLVWWDAQKNTNEMKIIDPRDIFIDPSATHIRNAKWVQVREFTTKGQMERRGFDTKKIDFKASTLRSNRYESRVKENLNLEDRTGQDVHDPVVEVVTEWRTDREIVFLPQFNQIVRDRKNPYKHQRIPIAQLRYYPNGDDVFGESELEPVISLWRAIQANLCGYLETMNNSMRPPLKIVAPRTRIETIVYGPGAQWLMDDINAVQEAEIGTTAIGQFQNTYPVLIAAFNTAMGDESLGTSNVSGQFTEKTATEVRNLQRQQLSRDQYNQLYLSDFLKDVMQMWVSNNQQYLFDDPSKNVHIMKIVGRDKIGDLEQLGLADKVMPREVMKDIMDTIENSPEEVTDFDLQEIIQQTELPRNAVIMNPDEKPEDLTIKPKMEVSKGQFATIHVTPEDMEGTFDYIPDVKSMSIGASQELIEGRKRAFEVILNPQIQAMMQQQGSTMDISDFVIQILEDEGIRDAERLFKKGVQPTGPAGAQGGQGAGSLGDQLGVPELPKTPDASAGSAGLPKQAGGIQNFPAV